MTVRRITFQNVNDLEVAILGSMGFSTAFIMERTGLTKYQVVYRLTKAEVKRADYRNGHSRIAKSVILNRNFRAQVRDALVPSRRRQTA